MIVVYFIFLLLSYVCVINMMNGVFIIVCVNDCGFYECGCIIDFLSKMVEMFDMKGYGIVKVWV